MVRAPYFDNTPLKKGAWSPEEDLKLKAYVKSCGIWNWTLMPKPAGLLRSGKSCRLRWMNYLRPDLKRGKFSREEDQTILRLHRILGNRWSAIAARLPGRTDNAVKNHWHTKLKKLPHKANPKAITKLQAEKTPAAEATLTGNPTAASTMESPQLSTESDSSSSINTSTAADGIEKNQRIEGISTDSAGIFEDHQGSWAQPFPVEDYFLETLPEPELKLPISEEWVEEPLWKYGSKDDNYWLNLYMVAEMMDGI